MEKKSFEMQLAQNGSLAELRKWWDHTFFSHEAQVVLVERQDEELLCEYASRFSFCDKAQIRLAQLRLKKALLKQLDRHSLCVKAQRILVETAL